jgi:hypothetical protein
MIHKTVSGLLLPKFECIHSFKAYKGDILQDENGHILNELVYEQDPIQNLVVNTGKNLALDRLFGLSAAVALTSVGVGTDSTAAVVGQIQLNPTVAGSVLLQTADAGTARASQTVTIASTFGTGVANFSWNEGALFNGNTNGTSVMFNRIVFGPFNKTSAVAIVYQVQVTQS